MRAYRVFRGRIRARGLFGEPCPVNLAFTIQDRSVEELMTSSPAGNPIDRPVVDTESVRHFCERNHIRKLSLFGSVLRDDFGPTSDIDVLVEFDPEHVPGLDFLTMQDELSEILGRRVDLNTPNSLSPYFRNKVLAEAEVKFAGT